MAIQASVEANWLVQTSHIYILEITRGLRSPAFRDADLKISHSDVKCRKAIAYVPIAKW